MAVLNALTVDVEDWFHVSLFRHQIKPSEWDGFKSTVVPNVCRILDLFGRYDVKATFFILGWVAERFPEVVIAIKEQGHEIASHGYWHQIIYENSKQEFYRDVKMSIELLERISGQKVKGYRAPSYSITRESMWAWEILGDLGLEYDSSVFPVKHDVYGIEDVPRFPFCVQAKGKRQLVEFPISTTRILGRNVPIAGGGYLRLYPYWFFKRGIEDINAEGKPAIVYFHPWEIDPYIPRINVGKLKRLRHYGNLELTAERIEMLLQEFRFAPAEQVLKQAGPLQRWPSIAQNGTVSLGTNGTHKDSRQTIQQQAVAWQ